MTAATPEPQPVAIGTVAGLLQLTHGRRLLLATIGGTVLVAAVLDLVPPLLVRTLIDDHLIPGRSEGLLRLAFLYLGAVAGVGALTFVFAYLSAIAAQGALHELRIRLFVHLQRIPVSYHDTHPLGDSISRCTADIETIERVFSTEVATLIQAVLRLASVTVAMFVLNSTLAVVALLIASPVVAITRLIQVRVRDAQRDQRVAVGRLNTHLQETLGGAEIVRAFAREEAFVARFRGALSEQLSAFNRSAAFLSIFPTTMAMLLAAATATLLWAGSTDSLLSFGVSIGTLVAFVLLLQRFFEPIIALGGQWQTVQEALSGAERVFEVLALPPEQRPITERPTPGTTDAPAIELDAIVFGYLPARPVLRDISLSVQPGEQVSLVGRTGAGKTSALHLLAGHYEPWSGAVRVAGVDPRALAEEQRRSVVGVVPQQVQLFSGTVRDNLALNDDSVEDEAIFRATRIAGVDALIRSLTDGYATQLVGGGGGQGARLSAGQRQLLALARALVRRPPVLLLDEATSAVDGASDAAFRRALRAEVRARGMAVLSVSHRLSTTREADRVVLLEAGEIIEQGAPEQLVRDGGRFAALLELEEAGWDWRETEVTTD